MKTKDFGNLNSKKVDSKSRIKEDS